MQSPGRSALLVLGTAKDPHVSRIVSELEKLGHRAIILDYLGDVKCALSFDPTFRPRLQIGDFVLKEDDVVWPRYKMFPGSHLYFTDTLENESDTERMQRYSVREQQWRWLYSAIVCSHSGRIINRGSRELPKPAQQAQAQKCGMHSPRTFVSNDREALLEFSQEGIPLIMKPIANCSIPTASIPVNIMTYEVTHDELQQASDAAFSSCPVLVQEQVKKDYEVRAFAVGNTCIAYRINSQDFELTRVDWRYGNYFLEFIPVELPVDLVDRIGKYLNLAKLDCGSFDFIVDKNGDYWFLECNSDGQWGWLEDSDDLKISRTLAGFVAGLLATAEVAV